MVEKCTVNLTEKCEERYPLAPYEYVDIMGLLLALFMFIFSLISWKKVADFRSFKNYILISLIFIGFINAILRNLQLDCLADQLNDPDTVMTALIAADGVRFYFELAHNYWSMFMFYNAYVDVAKNSIKATLEYYVAIVWGWLMPLIFTLVAYVIAPTLIPDSYKNFFIVSTRLFAVLVPLVFNLIVHIKVSYSMYKQEKSGDMTSKERIECVRIFSFLFIVNFLCLTTSITPFVCPSIFRMVVNNIYTSLKELIILFYFVADKHNTLLWDEYYARKQNEKLLNEKLNENC